MSQKHTILLIRQRPAFGDALLLGPLIRTIKNIYPTSTLTVMTDSTYMAGALPLIFRGVPGVDRVECVPSLEWTTDSNKCVDPILRGAGIEAPYSVTHANLVMDCNGAYMAFERQYGGDIPYGIQEFWLKHFNYYDSTIDLRPKWNIPATALEAVDEWLTSVNLQNKPMVGIVLRAGDKVRDWNYSKHSTDIADWLHTKGILPVGIDPFINLRSIYGVSCIGRQLDFVAALIQRCKVILTPDTGLLHLAEAVGTPTVGLWGIMRPELRVAGYRCNIVPKTSLGQCDQQGCPCCSWKFQRWSCLNKITLPMILNGLRESL